MYPVTLAGRVVLLREFRVEDAADALAVVGDDEVTRWLSFDSRDLSGATEMISGAIERAKLEPRNEYHLAVTLMDDKLIGFARLGLDGVRAGKIGYAIRADRWGHGYATDAAHALIGFGFHNLGLHRISAAIGPDNVASITLVKRLGMQYEGCIRHHVFTNGAWRDSVLYSILANEWTDGPR
jgi:ribosomal-protein-alanine N-acetyltransferase